MAILMFIAGLVLVIVGSNAFVDAAVRIAKRFRVSEMLIGATLVSIGTTLPELMVSATAAFSVIPCGSGCPGSAGPGTSCASVGSPIV